MLQKFMIGIITVQQSSPFEFSLIISCSHLQQNCLSIAYCQVSCPLIVLHVNSGGAKLVKIKD